MTLFRDDGFSVKMLEMIFLDVGKEYLQEILHPTIRKVGKLKKFFKEDEVSTLQKRLKALLKQLFDKLDKCPK
jgi:hypothetical protein